MRRARGGNHERYRTRRDARSMDGAAGAGFVAGEGARADLPRSADRPASRPADAVDCAVVLGARGRLLAAAVVVVGVFLFIGDPGAVADAAAGEDSLHRGVRILLYADDGLRRLPCTLRRIPTRTEQRLWCPDPCRTVHSALRSAASWMRLPALATPDPAFCCLAAGTGEDEEDQASVVGFMPGCADGTCLMINRYCFREQAAGSGRRCVEGKVVGRETILDIQRRRWKSTTGSIQVDHVAGSGAGVLSRCESLRKDAARRHFPRLADLNRRSR